MFIVDTNVLVQAVNRDAPQHVGCRDWLDRHLEGAGTVGFPWVVALGFIRIVTHQKVLPRPLTVDQALEVLDRWLSQPTAVVCQPSGRHRQLLAEYLRKAGTGGNLTTDAHLAALATELQATIVSFDRDFDRFPGVRWIQPT